MFHHPVLPVHNKLYVGMWLKFNSATPNSHSFLFRVSFSFIFFFHLLLFFLFFGAAQERGADPPLNTVSKWGIPTLPWNDNKTPPLISVPKWEIPTLQWIDTETGLLARSHFCSYTKEKSNCIIGYLITFPCFCNAIILMCNIHSCNLFTEYWQFKICFL